MSEEITTLVARCSAKKRGTGDPGELCRNTAGFKTDHVGTGRCFLHGGARGSGRPVVKGESRMTLAKEAEELRQDPKLLDSEEQVALLKVLMRRQVDSFDEASEAYFDQVAEWAVNKENDPEFDEEPPANPNPGEFISAEIVRLLTNTQKITHEMKFERQNSLPKTEVTRIMAEMADSFQLIARQYNMPEEAVTQFLNKVRSISIKTG